MTRTRLLPTTFLLACLSGTAMAEPVLDEVVVTAQKRSENLQDIPLSVSALSQDAIDERHVASMEDMPTRLPGSSSVTWQASAKPPSGGSALPW